MATIAQKNWRPTSLTALVLFILFFILRYILSLDVFSRISEEDTFQLLSIISIGLLILAVLALLFGIVGYIYGGNSKTETNKLSGNVNWQDGTGVIGAIVTVSGVKEAAAPTNRDGYFEIEVPTADSWEIKASYQEKIIAGPQLVTKEENFTKIPLQSSKNKAVRLSGNVYGEDGAAILGAIITAVGVKDASDPTNRDGYFEIEVPFADAWELRASYEGKLIAGPEPVLNEQIDKKIILQAGNTHLRESLLPTFEIGICTDGSPFQMTCTGEIVRGVSAAKRVVEEIEASNQKEFGVKVTGLERIQNYLSDLKEPQGKDVEIRHELQMRLKSWEKTRSLFEIGVKYILWHKIFRKTTTIYNADTAAETICGFSKECFEHVFGPLAWYVWYEEDQDTLQRFFVTETIQKSMNQGYYESDDFKEERFQGLKPDKAYEIALFHPENLHCYVIPPLLKYICEQKFGGVSQVVIDEYLDISKWNWSISDPRDYL